MLVTLQIQSVGNKNGKRLFFGQLEDGNVLFHSDYYRPPVVNAADDDPENWTIEPNPHDGRFVVPNHVGPGSIVRGVCKKAANGVRATAWCLKSEHECKQLELTKLRWEWETKQATKRREAEEAEAAYHAAEREARAANPKNVNEALELDWEIVPGLDHGRQVVLERLFAGESKPRRITKYRRSSFFLSPLELSRALRHVMSQTQTGPRMRAR